MSQNVLKRRRPQISNPAEMSTPRKQKFCEKGMCLFVILVAVGGRHRRRVCGHSHGQGPTSESTIPASAGVVENDHYLPDISSVIP